EGVVIILAVRCRAVAQRRGGDVEGAGVPYHRARTRFTGRAQRREHVVAAARGHAQAGDVHQHGVARSRHGSGQLRRHVAEGRSKSLRDGDLRELQVVLGVLHSASMLLARATSVQCAISSAMYLPNCGGVIGIMVSASDWKLLRTSGEASTLLICSFSFFTMASGSFAGPSMPYHVSASNPS